MHAGRPGRGREWKHSKHRLISVWPFPIRPIDLTAASRRISAGRGREGWMQAIWQRNVWLEGRISDLLGLRDWESVIEEQKCGHQRDGLYRGTKNESDFKSQFLDWCPERSPEVTTGEMYLMSAFRQLTAETTHVTGELQGDECKEEDWTSGRFKC